MAVTLTKQQEAACLMVNWFDGDFGVPGDRILKNKFVTGRIVSVCSECKGDIQPKERAHVLVGMFDGSPMSYRWCNNCCLKALEESGVNYEGDDDDD